LVDWTNPGQGEVESFFLKTAKVTEEMFSPLFKGTKQQIDRKKIIFPDPTRLEYWVSVN